ncbi:hypothetical protein F5Y12DRAFT_679530 [Xylaria sp. FL1777]|nr:hypothetical protein F5Y12DRAFT_679530 [Xylaria sp. FL1777]
MIVSCRTLPLLPFLSLTRRPTAAVTAAAATATATATAQLRPTAPARPINTTASVHSCYSYTSTTRRPLFKMSSSEITHATIKEYCLVKIV